MAARAKSNQIFRRASARNVLKALRESTKFFESAARVCENFENAARAFQKLIAAGHARDGRDYCEFRCASTCGYYFWHARSHKKSPSSLRELKNECASLVLIRQFAAARELGGYIYTGTIWYLVRYAMRGSRVKTTGGHECCKRLQRYDDTCIIDDTTACETKCKGWRGSGWLSNSNKRAR